MFIRKVSPLLPAAIACFLSACSADAPKDKVAISESGDGKSSLDETISLASSGNWTEVQTVDSPHAYRNNYTRRWDVAGSADAIEMRVVFTRFEIENGYDFVTVADGAGGQRTTHTGEKTGTEVVVSGNRVNISLTTDTSVTGWGVRLTVYERLPCRCTEVFNPVCGIDGTTYNNTCFAACENVAVSYRGACSDDWFTVSRSVESIHPYVDTFSNTWTIGEGGSRRMRVHFSRIDVERGYDFVTVLDANDRVVARYTGAEASGVTTPVVEGSLVKIKLDSDESITKFGFAIDSYDVQGGCASDAECAANETCAQPQCIRAPCFTSCQPRASGYQTVALATLNADPTIFDGQYVSVVAEPAAATAVCTKIACSPSSPCCNRCSAMITIGDAIQLVDATNQTAYGCGGDSCTWASTCTPFPSTGAGEYELRGRFTYDATSAMKTLAIDSFTAASCSKTGCSGNMCANSPVFSTCVYRPEYACYQDADCGAQADGRCGFTETPELDQCIANGGPVQSETVSATDTPLTIPDNNSRGVTSVVRLSAQNAVTPVRVSARITHTYRGDLRVVLVQPDGHETVLHDRAGGSFDDLVIENYFAGDLPGASVGGDWRLVVSDNDARDTGRIESFTVTLR